MSFVRVFVLTIVVCLLLPNIVLASPVTWHTKVPKKVIINTPFIYQVRVTQGKRHLVAKCSYPSKKRFTKLGNYKLVCRARTSKHTWAFTVVAPSHDPTPTNPVPITPPADVIAPELFLPHDRVLSLHDASETPYAIDDHDGLLIPTCSSEAENTGEHTISCEAVDRAGNRSRGSYHLTRLADPVDTVDVTLAAHLGDATAFPAPNDQASFKLQSPLAASDVVTTDNTYTYTTAQYVVTGKVQTGRIQEDIRVTTHQGVKTWQWQLDPGTGQAPAIAADGSIHFGLGLVIDPPRITDMNGHTLTGTSPHWNISGNILSLALDDTTWPIPYIIDPTTTYPSVSFTSGLSDNAAITPSIQTFDFTYTNGPAISIECRLYRGNIGVGTTYVYPGNNCNPLSSSFTTPYLVEGRYDLDIVVHNASGTSYARRVWDVDSSPPIDFTLIATGEQAITPMTRGQSLPTCALFPAQDGTAGFSVQFSHFPLSDPNTRIASITGSLDGGTSANLTIDAIGWRVPGGISSGGPHYVNILATNRAGISRTVRYDFYADNAPPSIPTNYAPTISAGSGGKKRATFTLNSTDDSCLRYYNFIINHAPITSLSPQPDSNTNGMGPLYWTISGDYTSFTLDGLPPGLYQYRIVSVDNLARGGATVWDYFRVT